MKVIHYTEIEAREYTGEATKGATGRIGAGKADGSDHFCMRIFQLEPGGYTPKHTHGWEHGIFIHQGEGEVFQEGRWTPLTSGTVVFIPAGEEHQLRNTGDTPMAFVCVIPSGFPEL